MTHSSSTAGLRRFATATATAVTAITGTTVTVLLASLLFAPLAAEASDTALLRLLQILRDRGSISAAEYEELERATLVESAPVAPTPERSAPPDRAEVTSGVAADVRAEAEPRAEGEGRAGWADTPGRSGLQTGNSAGVETAEDASAPRPPAVIAAVGRRSLADATAAASAQTRPLDAQVGAIEQRLSRDEEELHQVEAEVKEQGASIARLKEITDGTSPALVAKVLAGKWYERISLRGYTQFRETDVIDHVGLAPEVPADRSVNANESFLIRRGRFIFSGDLSDHLYLYAQSDFNASTGAADYSLQMRDLYADISLDKKKEFRVRLGQSKTPYGWVNLQSSQNRAPLERPDAINSAAEGERDLGAYLMWASTAARQRFRDLVSQGLKGSGDYGVVAVGVFSGQGLNRSDQNGDMHVLARASYPFKAANGQFFELGVQAYRGRFVSPTQAISVAGNTVTPVGDPNGVLDQRVGMTAIWYPQPFGIEAEWNVGRGPALSDDGRSITEDALHGGYVQANYRRRDSIASWFPFVRWNYFDGARKFARNAPRTKVNEVDFGLEFARWLEVELTAMYTHTFERTRTGSAPYGATRSSNRVAFQAQWNY